MLMHERYDDFAELLIPKLQAVFNDAEATLLRKRSRLRLLFELLHAGLYDDPSLVFLLLKEMVGPLLSLGCR
jgi:hypothetical protein